MAAQGPRNPQANLLGLPQELRDMIYDHVFTDLSVNIKGRGLVKLQPQTVSAANAGITMACKQLHHETIELYYKHATFTIDGGLQVLAKWLTVLPICHRALISDVRLADGPHDASYKPRADFSEFSRIRVRESWKIYYHGKVLLRKGVLKMWVTRGKYPGAEGRRVWEWRAVDESGDGWTDDDTMAMLWLADD